MNVKALLSKVVENEASDLHLSVGRPPMLRVDGKLFPMGESNITAKDTEHVCSQIVPEEYRRRFEERGNVDFAIDFEKIARFRVSIFRERGRISLSLRLLPYKFLSFEEIGLPLKVKDLLHKTRGLILVTGPTGSGKTTTLATMIDYINTNRDCHVITIEDPIEYYHEHKKSLIAQVEIGKDAQTFHEVVVNSLRADPDVILIGEMRDLPTMSAAITAAETGHLVFATLHTTGAARTVNRIINSFPTDQQEQIRIQLSGSIRAVISQVLVPKAKGKGRVAAFEIMIGTPAVQNLIREQKVHSIQSAIQTGGKYGMKALDQSLFELNQKGIVKYEEVIKFANEPDQIRQKFKK